MVCLGRAHGAPPASTLIAGNRMNDTLVACCGIATAIVNVNNFREQKNIFSKKSTEMFGESKNMRNFAPAIATNVLFNASIAQLARARDL